MADKKDDKKKAPDAAPAEGEEGAPKKKSKLLMIIMVVVGVLVLIGGSVGATLFLTGFFDPKPAATADAAEPGAAGAAEGEPGAEGEATGPTVPDGPQLQTKEIPAGERFAATYKPIERDFTLNVPNSRKFIQFRLAYKTFYGEKIVERVTTHQIAIEAAIIATAGQYTEEEMVSVDGRARLAAALRDAMNDVLIRNEDFGGIEEVMFTHFVFQ
ncbi:MAG: flagellar basal body-associated FliL family protein [Steroidobacteraceae bacterium]|jgi:flagellar FliL protein